MAAFFSFDLLLKIVFAFIASVSFAVILKVDKRHLLLSGVGAIMTYFIYALMCALGTSFFAAAFVSTIASVIYAEILARVRRAPAIVYIMTGVIPTVPGGDLYHAMRYLIMSDLPMAMKKLTDTLQIGLGIAGGIVTASILFSIGFDAYRRAKKRIAELKETIDSDSR